MNEDTLFLALSLRRYAPADMTDQGVSGYTARLVSLARSIERLNEAQCNLGLTGNQEVIRDRRTKTAHEIVAYFPGLTLEVNRDPRGPALRVHFPDNRPADCWGGGLAVPT